jgi:CRISPR-associated protein Csb2
MGYALREAILAAAAKRGFDRAPEGLYWSGAEGGHRHAYYLSEDRDTDGLIDHVSLFAEARIEPEFANALLDTTELCLDRNARFALLAAEAGSKREGHLFGPAKVWRAVTPFVTRLWLRTRTGKLRPDFSPSAQVARELRELEDTGGRRRLPEPVAIGWLGRIERATTTPFVLVAERSRPNGDGLAGFPVVTFAEPAIGPIAIGYGSHFGLGLLVPADCEIR